MFSIRSTEVKLAGNDVTHGDQVVYGSVSSGLGFSCLNQAVDPFKDTIVHPAVEPIQDAVPVRLDSFSGALVTGSSWLWLAHQYHFFR